MLQVSGNTALPTEAIIKTEGMIKDIDYSVETSAKLIVQNLLISSYFCTFIV